MAISRIQRTILGAVLLIVVLFSIALLHSPTRVYYIDPWTGSVFGEGGVEALGGLKELGSVGQSGGGSSPALSPADLEVLKGDVIMPKLGNETAKAELGRAAWKLMHTMTLRYPDTPTQDERDALKSYFYLTSRLYPCGECAKEFQELLKQYPPQTSSRQVASLWLCHVHNMVNHRLEKSEFDCTKLDETYDCGCGDPPLSSDAGEHIKKEPSKVDDITGLDMIRGGVGR